MSNTQSDNIADLAASLAKAQSEMGAVHKDQDNPYFRSKFAGLSTVWEAVKPALTKNGLSIVQMPGSDERGYFVQTQLLHSSGQWIRSTTYMKPAKEDPQGIGSLISYARRYALQAMVMACPDDDDGEAAMGRAATQKAAEAPKPAAKVETPKAKAVKATEPAKETKEKSKFNGEGHQQLFQKLMAEGITQDDFMAALRHAGTIPAQATDFFLMKEATAQKFLGELTTTIGVVREWIALYKP
jgi:hypothetical protein